MLLTREQLQERLIALHIASLELVKDVSLDHLLERIATLACEQAEARYAALGVLDNAGQLKNFISVGLAEDQIKRIAHPPVGLGLIGELMSMEEPLRVPVIQDHPHSVGFPAHHPAMTSFLGVPIRAGDHQLGQIYLTDKLDAPEFTADDEKIIQMLAAYAAAAIQNARLVEQMRERDTVLTRRSEDLILLNDIGSALTSSLELDEILNKALALVMNYMKVESGEIFMLEDDKETLRMVLHRGEAAEAFWTRNRFKLGEGFIGMVAQKGESVLTTDLKADGRFAREAVVQAGFRQMAALPLRSSENIMGVMTIATRSEHPLEQRSLQMLDAVANWAGLAIENARLHQNVRRLAVLEERDRIGMDLHDGIIQSIYGVGLSLESALHTVDEDADLAKVRIKQSIEGLNQSIRDIRTYILDLRPRQLGNDGLMNALKRLATEYRANTFAEVSLKGPQKTLENLPQARSLALFHICQETLANAAKHAGAKKVDINVWITAERVIMEIHDNGKGFDVDKMSTTIGHGLSNIQTRARSVGGEVDITSIIGEGTTVLAWVPRDVRSHE
ncbi:MAG: GAF domain-containing sensor histidine kinase [Chloroflexi bacterium]|nr:GAF domain-containing sensor histidine kinase [Chloroflexota bacterium]MBI3340688.1 GAF domain-containing sensor histidine kinase [Chloroflexota bacterium]